MTTLDHRCVGLEQEFFLVDEDGVLSNLADEFLARCWEAARTEAKNPACFAPEVAMSMVEANVPPARSLAELLHHYLDGLELAMETGRRMGLRLYPLATYPLPVTPALRNERWYQLQARTVGEERFSHAGRCVGVHLHLGVHPEVVDPRVGVSYDAPNQVSGIDHYYAMLRATLEAAAPPGVEDPVVALVTGGPEDPAFFEHRRIAEACGLRLLTLEGCHIRGGEIRANSDGRRIDVIYRRFEEGYVTTTGLPQLEEVSLEGKVNVVNALGVGVADDKAVFCYVPTMIERYLGEKPILGNTPTFSLFDPEQRAEVLERLAELVVKPRDRYGGKGLVIGPEASREDLERVRREITENPTKFVAQECLDFSTHVLGNPADGSSTKEVFIDLRAFVLPAVGYVMPGGLTRVASPGTRVVNSSAGGSFKDTWVLEADPEVN